MKSKTQEWSIALIWPNVAVGVVVLILILQNRIPIGRQWFVLLAYSLFYANAVSLLGVLLFKGLAKWLDLSKLSLTTILVICVVVIVPAGCLLIQTLLMAAGFVGREHFWREYGALLRTTMPLAAVFASGAAVHSSLRERLKLTERKLHEKELAEERARKLLIEARLHALEARIQPHFLFNTLNSISSLIGSDPPRAEKMLGRLAALLRASLDAGDRPLIPLRDELAMVEGYLDIERARFGNKLLGSVNVPVALQGAKVPPMSVQALVENAVKHGIASRPDGGEIHVAASAEGGKVRVEVSDTGAGFDLAEVPAGHGLDNLVERLDALFGAKARLNSFQRNGHCIVEMVVPNE